MATEPDATPASQFIREENFESLYANNVQLEASIWDLKLIFGQLDQSSGKAVIEQHTAVSIPWIQAKLLAYFFEGQVAAYEADHGSIKVPAAVVPVVPDPSQVDSTNELGRAVITYFVHRHKWYFGDVSPAQPEPQASQETPESETGAPNVNQG